MSTLVEVWPDPAVPTRWHYKCRRCGKVGQATSNGHESPSEVEGKALMNAAQHLRRCKGKPA